MFLFVLDQYCAFLKNNSCNKLIDMLSLDQFSFELTDRDWETYFILLKRTAKKENVEILRVTSGPKKTQNSLNILQNAVINIERNNYIKNRLNCKYCDFYQTEHCK